MKLLSIRSLLAFLVIATCTFVSCKKNKDAAPPSIIVGSWEGKYGLDAELPNQYFAFVINQDGTMQVIVGEKNDPQIGKGTWTLQDNEFKAVYYYGGEEGNKYNIAAKFDEAQKKLTGSWGIGTQDANAGDFYMIRQ